jgi:two-component system chemotaxis response regulator CheY
MRMMLKSLLQQVELTDVVEAGNGIEGVAALKQQQVDVIILDLHMPEMDGISFLRTVKEHPTWTNIPVIIISSDGEAKQIDEAKRLGACSYVTKPFRVDGLRQALQSAFPARA